MSFDPQRIKNAIWGAFIADSISMPVHWYYKRKYIKEGFDGGIKTFKDAPHPHPESFMVGAMYHPNIQKANELNRKYDILHDNVRFYDTNYADKNFELSVHEGEHANAMPQKEERYHYHHGLKAGENTLGANLLRVLMRSVISSKSYNQEHFLHEFIAYMSDADKNKDPYTERYIREWFTKYTEGAEPTACAEDQRNIWSISSNGGIIRPLLLSLSSASSYKGLGIALSHQQLTHKSDNISSALSILVPFLHDVIHGHDLMCALDKYASQVSLIKISGKNLTKRYFESNGPGNIPKDEMYKIHAEYSNKQLDLDLLLREYTADEIYGEVFSTACYPEHSLPILLYILKKNCFKFKESVLENANVGGDNVHRGMILGMLCGAANEEIPQDMKEALVEYKQISKEIDEFVKVCTKL